MTVATVFMNWMAFLGLLMKGTYPIPSRRCDEEGGGKRQNREGGVRNSEEVTVRRQVNGYEKVCCG